MPPGPRTSKTEDAPRASSAVAAGDWAKRPGFFRGLAPGDISAIVATAQRRRVAKHACFFHQGAPASTLHVLAQGRTKLVQTTPEGHQVVVRIVGAGDMFGGVAILGDAVYPATAEAISASEALVWPSPVVARLIERHPALALNALRVLAARLGELQDRYRELATERVEQRIARALVRLVRQAGRRDEKGVLIDMDLSRQDLAELTGTTLYTVSRIVSGWQERGIVESSRTRVVIRDPHGLVAIAEDLPRTGRRPHCRETEAVRTSCSLRSRKDGGTRAAYGWPMHNMTPSPDMTGGRGSAPTADQVREALRLVVDPEVGVNIVDLGLVYGIDVTDGNVHVDMTMTTPACPLSEYVTTNAESTIRQQVPGLGSVDVQLVWEPPWCPDMMSDAARQQLGSR